MTPLSGVVEGREGNGREGKGRGGDGGGRRRRR